MNSLVGYGVSSESDSDAEDVSIAEERRKVLDKDASPLRRTRNFLLESASSESDAEAPEEDPDPPVSKLPAPFLRSVRQNKLPPPTLNTSSDSSVFANPFKAQAEQKLSALQKHVPLTMQAKPAQIGGKRMCVSYRKDGRCRFGIKCKFAHDSDLQTLRDEPSLSSEGPPQEVSDRSQEKEAQQARKRKVGLSNTLIPPKRAMKHFAMQRERERLNMEHQSLT